MNRTITALIIIAGVICLGLFASLAIQRPATASLDSITIGMTAQDLNTLIIIADNKGYFAANGLNVIIRTYDTGKDAVDGLLRSDADIATATEYVMVRSVMSGSSIRSMGTIAKSQNVYLVGLTDHGIHTVPDLAGKKIGFSQGTMDEFHVSRFLTLHGMSMQEVIPVDLRGPKSVNLPSEDVDAFLTWEPYYSGIRNQMGDRIVSWPAQGGQPFYYNVLSTNEWIGSHPGSAQRFLKSLSEAELFFADRPAEATKIVQDTLHLDDAYIASVWPGQQYSLTLDQSLISAMGDEARWIIASNLTNATSVPDFRNYIYTKGLDDVNPGTVNIFR
jgi:NitT/TauT family transport system substrate-binding protein